MSAAVNRSAAQPFYIISPASGLAYLQIPKAACSAIQAALLAVEKPKTYREMLAELRRTVSKLHVTPRLFTTASEADTYLRFTADDVR